MIETSTDLGELAAALSKAQAEIKGAVRDSENEFFSAKYADLSSTWEACRPALTTNGLSVAQAPYVEGSAVGVETMLLHASGQWMRSKVSAVPRDLSPQSVGSTITYLRRYSLAAVAGVAPEDDDGEAAQNHEAPAKPRRQQGPKINRPADQIGRPETRDPLPEAQLDVEVAQAFPDDIVNDPRPGFVAGKLDCPRCGLKIRESKPENGGGWYCWAKKGGCGAKWPALDAQTASGKPVDTATGEVKEDDRPFLLGAVIRGLKGFSGTQRGELFTVHLDGNTPEKATRDQLHALYVFLGDDVKVAAWLKSPTPA